MNSKSKTVLWHLIGWAIVLSIQFLWGRPGHYHHLPPSNMPPNGDNILPFPFFTHLALIPLFYLNSEILFPKFFRNRKYFLYGLLLLISISAVFLFLFFVLPNIIVGYVSPPTYTFVANSLTIIVASVCYCLVRDNIKAERILKEKETERLKSELLFLRWQISPHFLFNVLNNMVALARIKSDNLEPMLIRLSHLMRYMLYEQEGKAITLSKELEYLQSYIELQNLRFGTDVKVLFASTIPEDTNYFIEPMLLIPFVENAYKHGIGSKIKDPEINISLKIENDNLIFEVKNKYAPKFSEVKDDAAGIGLSNVERRLMLLYKAHYSLNVALQDGWHISLLKLNLNNA